MTEAHHRVVVPVGHTDTVVANALQRYAAAYFDDTSMLVRPVQPYDGLSRVAAMVAARSGGSLLVTDLSGTESVEAQPAPVASTASTPEGGAEPLLAFHTSGSTGSPSCVVYRKHTAREHARAIAASLDLVGSEGESGPVHVALPPPRFAYGLSIVDSHLEADVPVTFTDAEWGLPGLVHVAETTDRDLAVYALPQHAPLLLSADIDPQRLVRLFIAGGRISAGSVERLAEHFGRLELVNMYGQAEMGPRLSMWRGTPTDFVEGTIGRPLPGVTLRVQPNADAAHTNPDPAPGASQEAPDTAGGLGRIVAASPYAMAAVIKSPYEAIAPGPGTGEITTTDLAEQAPDGTLRHGGRADHVLNVAGTKVDLRRVQQIVTEATSPLVVKVDSRAGTVSGDSRPVIEIVPGPDSPTRTGPVRRALDAEFGRLAGLFDIRFVRELTLKESGK